jgi:peroxiredoxin
MLQAGDLVPEMTVEKVIASPDSATWRHENLIGRVTVFVFFPNIYDSTEALSRRWNELVDRFADKVQFVMIARDDKSKLKPWLERNPLKGWLLLDSNSEMARAFGRPNTVFVDRNGRILGFGQEPLPFDSQIEDVLAGRVARPRLRVKPIPPGGDKPDVPPDPV